MPANSLLLAANSTNQIMSRFTKAAAIEQITERAKGHMTANGFDLNNGTSQLWPRGADERTKALIDMAVSYGTMRALMGVAEDIESGHLGVSKS